MKQYPLLSVPPETFEEICRELAAAELGNIFFGYGSRGFQQRGIDLIGYHPATGDITIVECKRHQRFTVRLLNDALSRFQEHVEFWQKRRVGTLVLCVASDPQPDAVVGILAWIRRLSKQGLRLHVWSHAALQRKLQDNPAIALRYFGPPIVPNSIDGSIGSKAPYFRTSRNQRKLFVLLDRFGFDHFASVAIEDDPTFTLEFQNYLLESCNSALSKGTARPGVGLAVCRDVLGSGLFSRSWKYRRAFSRALGISLGAAAEANRGTLLHDVVLQSLATPEGAIALAAALTEREAVARLVSPSTWRLLIGHKHPQVRWRISGGWSLVAQQLDEKSARTIEKEMLTATDSWGRRRLILTFLHRANRSLFRDSHDRTLAVSLLRAELDLEHGSDFVGAVRGWLAPAAQGTFDEFFGITAVEAAARPKGRTNSEREIEEAGDALSVFCLRLDCKDALRRGSIRQRYGPEGRYGLIKQRVAAMLSERSGLETDNLIADLLGRFDEGIRWALISLAGQWLPYLTPQQANATIKRALEDEHPWVVREMLTFLGSPAWEVAEDSATLIQLAMHRLILFTEAGWDLGEFMTPLMQASGRFPVKRKER